MSKNINIDVHHVTRVEGHGNIVVNIKEGTLEKCEWQVPESPRFFEAMIRGRHYSEVARIVSRICGICSIGHTLASVKASEKALGIEVSEQINDLRTLLKHAENFDSHILHILFLAAPDLLNSKSVFPLVATHGKVITQALELKRFGHEWGSLIAGRTTHPTMIIPGGASKIPSTKEIQALADRIQSEILPTLTQVGSVLLSLAPSFPQFNRPTEYMALYHPDHYAVYLGDQVQTVLPDGKKTLYLVKDYLSFTKEYVSTRSTAKYTKNQLDSYMAGALARLNNNFDKLHSGAQEVAKSLGISALDTNPYHNTLAQFIEVVHSLYESVDLCKKLVARGLKHEPLIEPTRFGGGSAAVEVPRGILFHYYKYDHDGLCISGDCIIPTNQNHGNIQLDFEKLVPEMLAQNLTEKEMELRLEMLVRAYDPCISCSTHYLNVQFKK